MIVFQRMAKRHWEKYLPALTEELKRKGIFQKRVHSAAKRAARELAHMVQDGAQLEAAKELVLERYILLPPETLEENSEEATE